MRSLATTPLGAGAAPTASVPAPPTTGVTWVASLRRVLRFEALTVWRTSNRWVVPLVIAAADVLSVLTARYSPAILKQLVGGDLIGLLPGPSWQESYAQWVKNLSQLVIFAVILTGAGATSNLISSGRAQLFAVRPVTRWHQPVAAYIARLGVVAASVCGATLLTWWLTRIYFADAPIGQLIAASAMWMALAALMLAVSVGFSAWLGSTLGSAGATIGVYLVLSILSALPTLADHSPAGLIAAPTAIVAHGIAVSGQPILLPLLSSAVLALIILSCGAWSFARREL